MKAKTVLLLSVLLLIASGCASQSQLEYAPLPQAAKPQAPSELMQPEPEKPSSYQKRLSGVFDTSQKPTTEKPIGSAPR